MSLTREKHDMANAVLSDISDWSENLWRT